MKSVFEAAARFQFLRSALALPLRKVVLATLVWSWLALASPGQQPAQTNPSRSFGPDACGPADPAYIRSAEQTGGLPMFLQRSEAVKAMKFMAVSTGENRVTLFWATDTLAGDTRQFAVPVDSTVENITFAMSTDTKGTALAVFNPTGAEIKTGDARADITELNCGRFLTLTHPAPGEYRLRVSGSGRFWLSAEGRSEIFLVGLEFVEPGGRIGHEGMFRISGQPLADRPATLQVQVQKEARDVAFHLVSHAGKTLQAIELHGEDSGGRTEEYSGTFKLPATPFRVMATGRNQQGEKFQRIENTLYHAETVAVTPESLLPVEVPLGRVTTITFKVLNLGEAATFKILAADAHRFITRVEPKEFQLAKGESAKVEVDVTVPATAKVGTGDDIPVVATSVDGPHTQNSAVQPVEVVAASTRQ